MRVFRTLHRMLLLLAVALTAGSRPSYAIDPTTSGVSVTGSLSSKAITDEELLLFTLTVKNKTSKALNAVRLVAPPDSYQFGQICAYLSEAIHCYQTASDFSAAQNVLMTSIPSGASYTAWGYLKPTTNHKQASLNAIVEWKAPDSPATSSVVVSLGENAVQGCWGIVWNWLLGFVKIFAIPFTLAVIGYYLNQMARKGEEQRANEAARREAVRQALQQKQSVSTETLKQMLPVSLSYAAECYLPLSSAAEGLVREVGASNRELAFYYAIYFQKRMDLNRAAIGGFYFKDLRGERLAAECGKKYALTMMGKADAPLNRAITACVSKLEEIRDYESFTQRFQMIAGPSTSYQVTEAQKAWQLFDSRLNKTSEVKEAMLYLSALYSVLDFEANRPFEYWYDTEFRLQAAPEVLDHLRSVAKDLKFTDKEMEYFTAAQTT